MRGAEAALGVGGAGQTRQTPTHPHRGKGRGGRGGRHSGAGTHAWLGGTRKFPRWLGFRVPHRGRVLSEPAPSEGARKRRRPGDQVTHSLGNNRADKLRGARRSQARVCGPDVPSGGPRGWLRAPHARPRKANSRPASSSHLGRPAPDSRNNEAGSAAPGPRAPSPERRAGRAPLPGPGPRGSRLRPAARSNLDAALGSARYKGT